MELNEQIKELGVKIDNYKAQTVSKEELETLKTELAQLTEKGVTKEQLDTLNSSLMELKESQNFSNNVKTLKDLISEKHQEIKNLYAKGSGYIDLEIKAVADITTANGVNTTPPAITGVQQAPLGMVNLRDFDVTALTTNVNTSLSAYPYTEAKPKDGDYSFVAEGTAKPQTDFNWETNYAKPVKAAAWIRLTDESVQDVVGLESVANDLLRRKHNIAKSKGILFGDGISPNPKGATTYGRLFVAGAMATSVVKPNFMDVVNACITDIGITHNYQDEMPYMANLVLINPIDFYIQLVSAKDDNGLPLYPTASLFNQVVIGGVTIRPEETIPTGKIFVCDMTKYNTTNYVGYNVRIGWVNDDLIKNQFVILAESRFHAFVKKLDEQAFIYDDIATIKTAITAV